MLDRRMTPFLLMLQLELREMIYRYVLCFDKIEIAQPVTEKTVRQKDGVKLQHNPMTNLLSLLATNRLVYNEARRIFYRCNTFVIHNIKDLPFLFLGIGRDNASCLQSVYWEDDESEYENQIDWIKKYTTQGSSQEPPRKEINIWNNRILYMDFLDIIDDMTGSDQEYHGDIYGLLSRDSEHVLPTDTPTWYVFAVDCHWGGERYTTSVTAGFEFYYRNPRIEELLI